MSKKKSKVSEDNKLSYYLSIYQGVFGEVSIRLFKRIGSDKYIFKFNTKYKKVNSESYNTPTLSIPNDVPITGNYLDDELNILNRGNNKSFYIIQHNEILLHKDILAIYFTEIFPTYSKVMVPQDLLNEKNWHKLDYSKDMPSWEDMYKSKQAIKVPFQQFAGILEH